MGRSSKGYDYKYNYCLPQLSTSLGKASHMKLRPCFIVLAFDSTGTSDVARGDNDDDKGGGAAG